MATVNGHGIAVRTSPGWDVRIGCRPVPRAYPTMHAATFALPADIGDYGDGAVQQMTLGDVFVALVEFDPASTRTALFAAQGFPPPLQPDDVRPGALQRPIGEQAGAQRFFSAQGRAWCLYVVVGSYRARAQLVGRANQLAIEVESR